jgi:hypothetical protein
VLGGGEAEGLEGALIEGALHLAAVEAGAGV